MRLGIIIFLSCLCCLPCKAAESVIYGAMERPFPSLMPLDYSYCRAVAWIDALKKAEKYIPAAIEKALHDLELEGSLVKLAICALACPVDVVTPEISAGEFITVYLHIPKEDAFREIMDKPELLVLEMCLFFDTVKRINQLSRGWPDSLAEAREKMTFLESTTDNLDELWKLMTCLEEFLAQPLDKRLETLKQLSVHMQDSAAILLLLAESLEKANMPHAAMQACDEALELCQKNGNFIRDKLLAAQIYYIRGLVNLQMDQLALAEADLQSARKIIEDSGIKWNLLPRILIAHGELRALRQDFAGMCDDFFAACANGHCEKLSLAVREGKCQQKNLPPLPMPVDDSLPYFISGNI